MSKIAKESAFFFFGTFIPAAISFVSVPIFTRYFTPQEYGVNALIDTTFGYANTLLFGIICSVVWRYYNVYKSKDEVDIFLGTISFLFRISVLLVLFLSIVFVIISKFELYTKKLIVTKTFALLLSAYVSVYGVILRLEGKAKAFNAILIFNSLSNFALIYLLAKVFCIRNIAMYISGIITYFFADLFLVCYFRKHKKTYLSIKKMLCSIKLLLPYALISLLSNFVQNVVDSSDRYMISGLIDVNATGLYDKLYGVSNGIMAIFCTVFMNLFAPYVHKSLSEKKAYGFYMELMPVFVGIFLPLLMYYSVFSDTICALLLAKEYSDWYFIIPCISFGYFFVSLAIFPELIIRYENPKLVPFGYLLALVINVLINLLLIPKLNILGAAIGTVVAYFSVLVYFCIVAKLTHLKYYFKKRSIINYLYLIPIIECLSYYLYFRRRFLFSNIGCVFFACIMASTYFLPYLYYYFIRNKCFAQLFEEK